MGKKMGIKAKELKREASAVACEKDGTTRLLGNRELMEAAVARLARYIRMHAMPSTAGRAQA